MKEQELKKQVLNENESMSKIERIVELSLLYDFYGALLKEHQKQIFEDYVLNDLSLGEIAADEGISRQGVYDIVKRCSKQLIDYEIKMKLIEKFEQTKLKVNQIKKISGEIRRTGDLKRIDEIEQLSDCILTEQ